MTDSKTYHVFMEPQNVDFAVNTFIVNADYPQIEDGTLYLKEGGGTIKAAFPADKVRACVLGTGKHDKSLADKH